MAKRRADETAVRDSPSKRCRRSLRSVDTQLQPMLPPRAASRAPPSSLALLGGRKRPHRVEEAAAGDGPHKVAPCDAGKHVAKVSPEQTSGSFEERRTFTKHNKRHREDDVCPNTVVTKASEQVRSDEDTNTEDCTYNSFQYWRVPLPELDLSLLQDAPRHSHAKHKDVSSEAMET